MAARPGVNVAPCFRTASSCLDRAALKAAALHSNRELERQRPPGEWATASQESVPGTMYRAPTKKKRRRGRRRYENRRTSYSGVNGRQRAKNRCRASAPNYWRTVPLRKPYGKSRFLGTVQKPAGLGMTSGLIGATVSEARVMVASTRAATNQEARRRCRGLGRMASTTVRLER